jgi:hypothetical protein
MEGVCSAQLQAQNKHSRGVRSEGEMNNRKLGSFVLCAVLFALGVPSQAQQPAKIPRIGYVELGANPNNPGQ